MIGLVNIYKEKGFTSHDVVNVVRRLTKSKAGHTGTLDPNATGVLPVCLGRATKIADYVMAADKEYVAEVVFGAATDTLDSTGQIVDENFKLVKLSEIEAVLPNFIGEILQIPPKYSAIKVSGKKLYEYARAGDEVEIKPREVFIHNIEILEANLPRAVTIRVSCSKGTYIRSLCADLGEKLETLAHMGELLRTRNGNFCVEKSMTLSCLEELAQAGRAHEAVMPIEVVLSHLPRFVIKGEADKWLKNGNKIPMDFVVGLDKPFVEEYLAFTEDGVVAGIFAPVSGFIKPKVMLMETRGGS